MLCLFCRTNFTIRILAPNYNNGGFPQFCNSTARFDPKLVEDLLPRLNAEWPSYSARGGDDLWEHEYEKHGTCAEAAFANEHDYFEGVLALHEHYDLLVRLSCCRIHGAACCDALQ